MDLKRTLERITRKSREAFASQRAMISFATYLQLLMERPYSLTRTASQYLRDLFEHHGAYEVRSVSGPIRRWHLFDDPEGDGATRVFGQEEVQNQLYDAFSAFAERGQSDRFVLLHGPNGSSKSSLTEAIRVGLERFSRTDAGPLFRFSWIFCEGAEKGALGFSPGMEVESLESLAEVDDKLISSRIPCEMKDPPFFLIPKRRRLETLKEALDGASPEERERFHWTDFVVKGELSPKNKVIYESLLRSYRGDWSKVVRHIRVERFYLSHRYRTGAVTIEPQGTIDAASRMLGHGTMGGLPPVLTHEDLVEAFGDLVDGNTGMVEYTDFLKRNLEANKYLLTTAERGFVTLPSLTVSLNLVLVGTTNEKYLTAFKRDPSFPSFKGRLALIRVPYLREYAKEAQIYQRQLRLVAAERHIAPHTTEMAGLWAVLTRLRRPDPSRHSGPLGRVVKHLTPLQKALLYATGELPEGLDEEEQTLLRGALAELAHESDALEEEFEDFVDAAYEGRRGASPREMMSLLTELVLESEAPCLTPIDLFEALPRLTADPTLYAFLRIPPDGEYHDIEAFLEQVRRHYVRGLRHEVQKASDLVDESEYHRLFTEYMLNVKAFGTGEKVADHRTGKSRDPDAKLMSEVEDHLGVRGPPEEFRRNLITKVAAFRLSNPEAPLEYPILFRDHLQALERSFYQQRRGQILSMVDDALVLLSGAGERMVADRRQAAENLISRMVQDCDYCPYCVGPVLGYFQRHAEELDA